MKLHQVRLNIPIGTPSWAWSNITKGTLILHITLVRSSQVEEGSGMGSDGHMTSDGRCSIKGSVTADTGKIGKLRGDLKPSLVL